LLEHGVGCGGAATVVEVGVLQVGVSKRASPARFGPTRFWPVLNEPGRAGSTRRNMLLFWARPAGWRAGGLARHPFPDMFILWSKIRF